MPSRRRGRIAASPRTPAAADQPHQHRLGLIVERVPGGDARTGVRGREPPQRGIAQSTGARLEVGSVAGQAAADVATGERHAESPGGGFRGGLVGVGIGATQAMVDVRRDELDAELAAELVQRQQQTDRVGAARDGNQHPLAGYQHRMLADGLLHRPEQCRQRVPHLAAIIGSRRPWEQLCPRMNTDRPRPPPKRTPDSMVAPHWVMVASHRGPRSRAACSPRHRSSGRPRPCRAPNQIRGLDRLLLSLGLACDSSAVSTAHRTPAFAVDDQYRTALGLPLRLERHPDRRNRVSVSVARLRRRQSKRKRIRAHPRKRTRGSAPARVSTSSASRSRPGGSARRGSPYGITAQRIR